jgi:hypothetical protein
MTVNVGPVNHLLGTVTGLRGSESVPAVLAV